MATSTRVLTINGGSSSVKFAIFDGRSRLLTGQIKTIGTAGTMLEATESGKRNRVSIPIRASDHRSAANEIIQWIESGGYGPFMAIGHRVVHGGLKTPEHQVVTPVLLEELRRTQPLDLAHLPREIALIEALRDRFPKIPQIACFDTVFHREMPRVAQLLPIPRRYTEAGVRRLGFHGLSYSYLMQELKRVDPAGANGRVILAHLGSGSSMAAVLHGRPIDTTMAFTPTAGLMMATRPGDLDPGLLVYLMRVEKMTPEQMDDFVSHCCGLLGVSDTTPDMRELVADRATDAHASEAVDLYCYTAKKMIGSYTAALGGLDTLVFSGGIGEHSPDVRAGICTGLEFLGLKLDPVLNGSSGSVISDRESRVTVRVIPTDEELMLAQIISEVLAASSESHSQQEG